MRRCKLSVTSALVLWWTLCGCAWLAWSTTYVRRVNRRAQERTHAQLKPKPRHVAASPPRVVSPSPPWFESANVTGERVLVALRTGHFFADYERVVPHCAVECEFRSMEPEGADAVWHHAPSACGAPPMRAFPEQVAVVMSMESAAYYSCLDDETYMSQVSFSLCCAQ